MNIPDKIYLVSDENEAFVFTQKRSDNKGIEYTRTDIFVEKAVRFLNYKLNYRVEITQPGTIIETITSREDFIKQFKAAMKDE